MRKRFVAAAIRLCLAGAFGQTSGGVSAPYPPYVKPSEDDLMLLSLHMDGLILAEDLEGYQHPGGVFIPFGEICRKLELAVKVSPDRGTADGYVGRLDRTVHIDAWGKKASYAGKPLPFDASLIEVHQNDIYIDPVLLNKWLPLGVIVDLHTSSIRIKPVEPIPMQLRLERERKASQARSLLASYQDLNYPTQETMYEALGIPAIDQSFSLNFSPKNGAGGISLASTTELSSDFAHQGADGYFGFGTGAVGAASHLSFGQSNPDGGLLGALNARQYSFGQIYSQGVPLVSDSHLTTGFSLGNYPIGRSAQNGVTTLAGELPMGWDVELYRGDILIDYRSAGNTGRYEFKNVPLSLGANRFILKFYGPHGERKDEAHAFNLSDTLVPAGQRWFRATVQPAVVGPSLVSTQEEVGLSSRLSGKLGFDTVNLADGVHEYGSAGLRGYGGPLFGYANLVVDPRSGSAEQIGGELLWKRTTIDYEQTFVNGLVSEVLSPQVNPVRDESTLRIGNLSMPDWTHLTPTEFDIDRQDTLQGQQIWNVRNRMSYQGYGVGITNWITWHSETGGSAQTEGELLVSRWQGGHLFQAQVTYDVNGTPSLQQIALQTTKILPDMRSLTFRGYYSATEANPGVGMVLTKNLGGYACGISLDLSSKHGFVLGLTASLGLLRNRTSGQWQSSAQSEATRGTVLVRAFLDTNGNGKYQRGEKLLPGIKFFVNASSYGRATGKDGTLLIDGLAANLPANISVAESTLTDPLWMSGLIGVRVIARPGVQPVIDFPIVATGEISGTVYVQTPTGVKEASGGNLELVDAKGHVLQSEAGAYDGYFTFSRVRPGKFLVRISQAALDALGARSEPVPITVGPAGGYIDGVRLVMSAK